MRAALAQAAPAISAAASRPVVRVLYKHLLRMAALHDSRPALKALLVNPLYTDPLLSRHHPRVALASDRFYGRGVRYYVDVKSLAAFVQSEFARYKSKDEEEKELSSLLNDAFYVLRLLKDNAARRDKDNKLFFPDWLLAIDPAAPSLPTAIVPPAWAAQPILSIADPSPVSPFSPSPTATFAVKRQRGRPRARRSILTELEQVPITRGMLLLAHPSLEGPFAQSVVLVTAHDEEGGGGTEGLIINRPFPGLVKLDGTDDIEKSILTLYRRYLTTLHNLTSPVSASTTAPSSSSSSSSAGTSTQPVSGPPLLYGGPVSGLSCLHRLDGFAEVSSTIVEGEWPVYAGQLPFWEKVHETLRQVDRERQEEGPDGMVVPPVASSSDAADVELFLGRSVWQPGQLRNELRSGGWLLARGNGLHVFTQSKQAKLTAYASSSSSSASTSSAASAIPMAPSSSPSSSSLLPHPAATLFTARPPPSLTFPYQSLWSHCMWQLGGEYRHFAQVEDVPSTGQYGEPRQKERSFRGRRREEKSDDGGSNIP